MQWSSPPLYLVSDTEYSSLGPNREGAQWLKEFGASVACTGTSDDLLEVTVYHCVFEHRLALEL